MVKDDIQWKCVVLIMIIMMLMMKLMLVMIETPVMTSRKEHLNMLPVIQAKLP